MPNTNASLNATIIGGGIAGLTAALRLAERGFSVKIFEKGPLVGGALSAIRRDGVYYDVYQHMFAEWYNNFWDLAKDVGLYRGKHFEKRSECAFLRQNDFPNYRVCTNIGAFNTGLKNMLSGVLTIPEMFLANYTILDALARNDSPGGFLENQTLNDFIVNRPYATSGVTRFFDEAVDNIWSINSYLSSALAYQRFSKYQFREPSPLCWVMKGDCYQSLIGPL
jgi:protoporphyrinogen oxidase